MDILEKITAFVDGKKYSADTLDGLKKKIPKNKKIKSKTTYKRCPEGECIFGDWEYPHGKYSGYKVRQCKICGRREEYDSGD